jgi:hypothetical protein
LENSKNILKSQYYCFFFQIAVLQKLLKQKHPTVLLTIFDFAVCMKFLYFLTSVWSSILPVFQIESTFNLFEKLYVANMHSEDLVREFLNFCLLKKFHSVESFIKRISMMVIQNDQKTVSIICNVIKNKLTDGFCWEAIKDLCKRAEPPREMIELIMLQCLKRKKNKVHISEVFNLVVNKLNKAEMNEINPLVLKSFLKLVQNKGLISYQEMTDLIPSTDEISIESTPRYTTLQHLIITHSISFYFFNSIFNITLINVRNILLVILNFVTFSISIFYDNEILIYILCISKNIDISKLHYLK